MKEIEKKERATFFDLKKRRKKDCTEGHLPCFCQNVSLIKVLMEEEDQFEENEDDHERAINENED